MCPFALKLGIDILLEGQIILETGKRIGLVSHTAAIDQQGISTAERIQTSPDLELTALLGPEHGFMGKAVAGELTNDAYHPVWQIPIYSLYGNTRKPTAAMVEMVDCLVVDFQDLGARPYTYVSTLRLVLEAAAEFKKQIIVADRPIPLAHCIDGPMLQPAFESFVGFIPAPMQYGMTQGETANWLKKTLQLDLDLRVVPMQGYNRNPFPAPGWPPWHPPSPRIKSWDSACLFTTTVFGEALPALDYGSGTDLTFQVIAAPWLDAKQVCKDLALANISGVRFEAIRYVARSGAYAGMTLDGLRLSITDYMRFRPVSTGVTILAAIQKCHGLSPLWTMEGTREEWFDKLFGTCDVRLALKAGASAADIINSWQFQLAGFERARAEHLLYSQA